MLIKFEILLMPRILKGGRKATNAHNSVPVEAKEGASASKFTLVKNVLICDCFYIFPLFAC